MICLLRSAGDNADCDYGPYGSNAVLVPVKGSIAYASKIVTPFTAANSYASMFLVSRKSGGGPHYTLPGNLTQAFTPSADGKSMTWSWGQAQFASADPFATNEYVDIVMTFGVTTANSPNMVYAFVSSATNVVAGPSTEKLLPLQFATGCLAAGTLVTLADGSVCAIEALRPGDRVRSGIVAAPLTVGSTSSGPEPNPLVWLRTDGGLELMLTEGHPLLLARADAATGAAAGADVAAGAVVVADELRLGDELLTLAGAQRIVALARRPYGGLVWNMKLGTAEELARAGAEHGSFYAGGVLVGDARLQVAEDARRKTEPDREAVLGRLPREWHEDYLATIAA